jgi:hypothetical protein
VSTATTTTTVTDSIYAKMLSRDVIQELRPATFMRSFFRKGDLQGQSMAYDFRLITSTSDLATLSNLQASASPSTTFGVDGTTAFNYWALSTTHQTATVAVVGTSALVGDVTAAVTVEDVRAEITGVLTRSLQAKWETDATANLANFSNTTTAAASQLSAEDLTNAIGAMEQRDVTTGYVGGFHPKQLADIRANIQGLTGEVWGKAGATDLQDHYRDDWGTFLSVTLHASSTVSSSGGNYQGAVFANQEALGLVELWPLRIETWRDKNLSTYTIGSMVYGSVEIDDVRGQTVLSSTA